MHYSLIPFCGKTSLVASVCLSRITAHNRGSNTLVVEVTGEELVGLLRRGAQARPAGLLGDSGDGASYRSSSAGGEAWSRGGAARAVVTRGPLFLSSPLLHVS